MVGFPRKDSMEHYQHPQAIVETSKVGKNTRIWAFAHILPGAVIGEECNICDQTFVENDVVIGNRVTVKCGVQLWDGVVVEDDVFIGPNATFTNDPFPRSKEPPEQFARTVVQKGASIGANATILPGLTIGRHAMVGAGAVVTRDVPPYAIVKGNPARIGGYVTAERMVAVEEVVPQTEQGCHSTGVEGVAVCRLPLIRDLRGSLSFAEYDNLLPFSPQRYFLVFDVPSKDVRGEHAHRELHQFLVCVKGSCAVVVDDGRQRAEVLLDRPNLGLYIPPLVWGIQYKYSRDAVLLVLASDIYKAEDYIRDYDEFLDAVVEAAAVQGGGNGRS
jgi:acetyltransferase-like isoleucine patch superfamily enzyme/dTDP-4-dehydrorhamnose 3,5-epimerase-like enzyme